MKRILSLIIIVLTLICINYTVYGNSALEIRFSDAIVTNTDGALCYRNGAESGDRIDYGTKLHVWWLEGFNRNDFLDGYVYFLTDIDGRKLYRK